MAESIKIPIEIVDQFGKPLAYLNSSLGGAYKSVEKVNSASRRMSSSFNTQDRTLAQLRSNVEKYRSAAENSFRLSHIKRYNILIYGDTKKDCPNRTTGRNLWGKNERFFL